MSISVTTSPDAVSLSKNPIYYELAVTDGGTPVTFANMDPGFYVEVDIQKETPLNSSLYESITQLRLLPDASGNVTLYIHSILDDELKRLFDDPPVPSFNSTIAYLADTLIRYRIRYREVTAATPDPSWTAGSAFVCLYGGIAQNLYSDYDFFAAMGSNNSILSWYPDKKIISYNQPEYLFWYNYTGSVADIQVNYSGYEEDGRATTISTAYTVSIPSNQVVILPVGPSQLSLDAAVRQYSVQVFSQGGGSALSQERTYRIDPLSHKYSRYIQYVNTFGCPETLRCLGLQSLDLEVERQNTVQTNFSNNSINSSITQTGYNSQYYFTYRTGPLSRYEVDALQELLIHNNLYEVYTEGYIPLLIVDDSYEIFQEGSFLYSLQFRARPTTVSKVYSNINIALDSDQEAWRTAFADYWRNAYGISWKLA